jgi:hypothetical protein
MTMTAILALITLALALSWTRIGRQGGGRTVTRLINCCHGCCHWRHLCLHSRDDGTKDDGRSNRQGRNPNIHGREEVGNHDPIGVEQQKQKQKQKQKQNQQQWRQRHRLYACRLLEDADSEIKCTDTFYLQNMYWYTFDLLCQREVFF